jgi:hypothetical protein
MILPVGEAIRPASGPNLEPEPADPVADRAGAADRRTRSRSAGSAHSGRLANLGKAEQAGGSMLPA